MPLGAEGGGGGPRQGRRCIMTTAVVVGVGGQTYSNLLVECCCKGQSRDVLGSDLNTLPFFSSSSISTPVR